MIDINSELSMQVIKALSSVLPDSVKIFAVAIVFAFLMSLAYLSNNTRKI